MSAEREPRFHAAQIEPLQDEGAASSLWPDDTAAPARSGIVIGRHQQTVVVTVHGELDGRKAANLCHVLADLIDGQGNLSLVVDLHDATTATDDDDEGVAVFAEAAERARRRGGAMTICMAPTRLHDALRQRGLGHLLGARHQHGCEDEGTWEVAGRERRAHPAGRSPVQLDR